MDRLPGSAIAAAPYAGFAGILCGGCGCMDVGAGLRDKRLMEEDAVVTKLEQVWRAHVAGDPRAQLEHWRQREPDTEQRLSIPNAMSQHVLVLLCSRYGLRPYRRSRQRSTTICLEAPAGFMSDVLWPMFESMAKIVEGAAVQMTTRIMQQWVQSTEQTPS